MAFSRGTIIKSFLWKLLEKSGSQVISFIVSIILARLLEPNDYGIIAIITIFINLANVVVDGGLNTALIQKKGADNKDFSTILYVSLILSAILYAILFVSAPLIAKFYNNDDITIVLRVLSISIVFCAYNSIQRAYVSKHLLFKKLFICSLVAVTISGIIGISMAYLGFGIWALVAQSIVSQVFTTLIMSVIIKWKPEKVFSFERFKGLFDYGWKIFATNFIIAIYNDIRGIVIGKLYQPASLAFFDRGKQFPYLIMGNINASLQTILFPVLSEEQDERGRVKAIMRRSTTVSCFFIFPLLVGLFVVSRPLILLLLTEKWLPAVDFLRIFCIAYMLMPMQIANLEAIKSMGYSNITLKLEIIKKVIEAIILVVSFMIGIKAVAWGVVVYNAICLVINLFPNIKLLDYRISEQVSDILPSLFASLIMGACIFWFQLLPIPEWLTLIIQFVSGGFLYILLSRLLRVESFSYLLNAIKNGGRIEKA